MRSVLPVLLHAIDLFLCELSAWAAMGWRKEREGEEEFSRASGMSFGDAKWVGEEDCEALSCFSRVCMSAGEIEE